MAEFINQTIESLAIGRSFLQPDTQNFISTHYRSMRIRDAQQIECDQGEVWLFDYGVIIFWGISEDQKQALLSKLEQFVVDENTAPEFEQYSFEVAQEVRMRADQIQFANEDAMERLAVSHALAQSVKLAMFESLAQKVILDHEYIPRALATTGNIPMTRKKIAKSRGVLFSARGDILLNFNLLDTPEFFWDYPEHEPLYNVVSRYLDIKSRITVLDKKLEAIHELLDMLANEQNHKHSSTLEWIIIVLIALEIVLFLY